MDKSQMLAHIEHNLNYSVFDVKWIPCSAKFVACGSKMNSQGIIQIFELDSPKLNLCREINLESAVKCSSFGASSIADRKLAVGDFSGKLSIIDLERNVPVYKVNAHKEIINSLDAIGGNSVDCGAPEIVTGSRDGSVKVWDPRQKDDPVASMVAKNPESSSASTPIIKSRDCWSVSFGDSSNNVERAVCAGYDNGDIKLFDLRKMALRWETNSKNGVCSIEFDRKDIRMNKMAIGTLEGGIFVYDMRTQHPSRGFSFCSEKNAGQSLGSNGCISGAKATIWSIRHSPQNRDLFASCGGAGSIRVWNYKYPDKRFMEYSDGSNVGVAGHIQMICATTVSQQPVHCFDWSPDRLGLAVCGSFDQTVRVLITTNLNLY